MSTRTGEPRVFRLPADGGEPEQLTTREGFTSATAPDGRTVFFSESISGPSLLWSVAADGGEATVVSDELRTWPFSWTVARDGIYFLDAGSPPTRLAFYAFASRRTTTVASLDERARGSGVAVSPDGRWLLLSLVDRQSDVMLVENFR
jgi:Tol biopolymer transport system component